MSKRGPIIVVGIVLILLLLVTPFAIGMVNENAMRRELDSIPAQTAIAASIESFDRGWFSSTAELNLGVNPQTLATLQATGDPTFAALGDFRLPIVVEIGHGPVLLDGGFGLGTASVRAYVDPDSELATLAESLLGMPYLFEFRGRGGFTSGFAYEGEIPAADFALPDFSVNWTALEFSGVIDGGRKTIDVGLDNVTLQSPFVSAILDSLAFTSDQTQADPNQFPLGSGGLAIGRLTVNDPLLGAAPIFSAQEGGVTTSFVEADDDGFIDFQVRYALASLTIGNEFDMSDAVFTFSANHLDAAALNELVQLTSTMTATSDPERLLADLVPISDRIVAGSPTIAIDPIRFSMPEGDFQSQINVALDPSALPTGSAMELQDLNVAISAISADIELSASKPLAQRLAAMVMAAQLPAYDLNGQPLPPDQLEAMAAGQGNLMLGMLAGQGIFVDDGDSYSTVMRFENGQLQANGQPLPLGF